MINPKVNKPTNNLFLTEKAIILLSIIYKMESTDK